MPSLAPVTTQTLSPSPRSTGGYVSRADDDDLPGPSRADGLERRAALAGPRRPAAERDGPARGARARRAAARARHRADRTAPTSRGRARRRRSSAPCSALPVELDARLREVDVGEWSGLTLAEVEERYPGGRARRRGGGTGWERRASRSRRWRRGSWRRCGDRGRASGRDGAGGHATAARCARCVAPAGSPPPGWHQRGNCEYDVLAVEAGQMRWLDSTRGGLHQQVQG